MMRSHSSRTLLAGVLVLALAGVAPLAGCDDRKRETLVCKDGTVTSGAGARDVCARHGGVR
jgi:hypothetical protein